ncbi:MAG: BACON domain-containing protein, partial [Candidatus Hydrogenedentes bacterium]|nr:BACON domain-containing protein [Candidatus Hydrogenedentota bacterium]
MVGMRSGVFCVRALALSAVFCLVPVWAGAQGTVYRVSADSTAPAPDGSTWELAYPDLQSAVDAAFAGGGGEIWVAGGTYTAATDPVLTMKGGVELYGGFSGGETARDDRDWEANETVIDGEGARRCVVGADSAVLDGFTVTGGSAVNGAGMLCDAVSPEVRNCFFAGNTASQFGGGLYVKDASPQLTGNLVLFNDALSGGGMAISGGAPQLTACWLVVNNADGAGGGLHISGGAPALDACLISSNTAESGGGVYNAAGSSTTLVNCLLSENQSNQYGGAILNDNAAAGAPLVFHCTVTANSAGTGGGGMHSRTSTPVVKNSIFWNNAAPSGPEFGSESGGAATVTYSCVKDGHPGEGNISDDPLFVDPSDGNYELTQESPCIDTATPVGAPDHDAGFTPRPQGAGYDMGCIEYFVSLAVNPDSQFISGYAGQALFEITTPLGWTAVSDSAWAVLDSESGTGDATLTVSVPANGTGANRTAKITVTAPGTLQGTVEVTVTQQAAFLNVTPTDRNVSGAPGTTTFAIATPLDWEILDGHTPWLTPSATSGNGDMTLEVSYPVNGTGAERTGVMVLEAPGAMPATMYLFVIQEAALDLSVTPESREVASPAGSTTFEIVTDADWTAGSDAAWASVSDGTGSGDTTLGVDYTLNDTGAERTATITVTGAGTYPESVAVTVVQAPMPPLSLAPDNRDADYAAGSVTYEVTTTAAWEARTNAPWAVLSATSGTGNTTLTVDYSLNSFGAERMASIIVTGTGTEPEVVVSTLTQAPMGLSVTPDNRDVDGVAGQATFDVETPGDWTAASDSAWATLVTESGSGDGQLVVGYAFNDTGAERTATITVTGTDTLPGTVEVTVTQAAAPGLAVTPDNRDVGGAVGEATFDVETTADWTAASDSAWATLVTESG